MAAIWITPETSTDDASGALRTRVARMMKWQYRTLTGLAVVLLLDVTLNAVRSIPEANAALGMLILLVGVCVLLAAIVAGVLTFVAGGILLCQIFRVGYTAFGIWSALVYTGLTFLLTFCLIWPGLFVIPQMVRLDVKRALGVDLDADQAI
jgi:hypothetical protein